MKPTAAQQMMIDDGLPVVFILSSQERHALWEANPPRNPKPFVDPRLEQDRQLREEEKKHKAHIRIQKMKAGLVKKATTPFSTKGLRWDTRHCKWVSDGAQENPSTQEDLMPKFMITPYDANGQAIKRAVTSIKDDADDKAITTQCLNAAKRGGSRVATVNVTAADGSIIKIHQVEKVQASAETAPADAVVETDAGTENEMAKKSKVKKVVKTKVKKVTGNGGLRAGSKQEMLYNMLTRKSGCTTEEAVKATGWQTCGVATWGKKFDLKVTKEKQTNGVTRYYGA